MAISREFWIISEDFRRPLPKMSEEPSKHLPVFFSSEAVNVKKLAISIANTKNYGQITLNTKPHSDPQEMLPRRCAKMEHLLHTEFMPGEGQVSITHEFK